MKLGACREDHLPYAVTVSLHSVEAHDIRRAVDYEVSEPDLSLKERRVVF